MLKPNLTRRTFLQASAASSLLPALPAFTASPAPEPLLPWPENGTLIPDEGWTLWVDRHADWKNDTLYLPEQITRDASGTVLGDGHPLPLHPPTGGWEVLTANQLDSISVTLPSSVEQHFWGKYGAGEDGHPRPYTPDEYRYAADDPIPRNGAYFGVSWWHRKIDIDKSLAGKRLFLHVRGAHLRAEVFLNRKLVGYSIMEELPFECDLTHAAQPGGENHLAIRITNPFGRFDWVDGLNAQWGAVKLYRSHGFGALDRGITLSAHSGPVRIKDAWVLNTPKPKSVRVTVQLESTAQSENITPLRLQIIDPETGKPCGRIWEDTISHERFECHTPSGDLCSDSRPYHTFVESHIPLSYEAADLWDIKTPKLFHLRVEVFTEGHTDTRTIPFGFRTFAPEGVGTDALFRLNGRRIKLYSAISWGFWGLNGMFPTPELAEKEVTQAKRLNLNCLNFHRNLAKEDVLRNQDRLGLLRYMEPGAGKLAIGKPPAGTQASANSVIMEKPTSPADKFAQRFMFTKCVEMVKAFRSHPSVIQYTLQNEIGADLSNPDTIAILEAMRLEDPSRCIVLNDGFVAPPRKAAQAWFEPWNPKLHRSDQEPWGGWWNQHQGAGDQWYDEFYKSPTDFTYKSPERKALSEFGEMEGCATPDNHALMLHQHADPAASASRNREMAIGSQPPDRSYDHQDHAEIDAAYNAWLDRWNFRAAFPSTESLYRSLGKKCYDTWQNYLENARISDDLDFAVISGWESTSIENHSGIVDNLRNFKSDPSPIAQTLQPIRPVAKQRSLCTALGQPATFDLFLLNDTSNPVAGTLTFTAVTPSGKLLHLATFPAPQQSPDIFSYLLKEPFLTPPLTEEGMYRFKFSLSSLPQSTQTKEIWVTHADLKRTDAMSRVGRRVAVAGITPALSKQLEPLQGRGCLVIADFVPGQKYDLIISSGLTSTTSANQNSGDTTGLESQPANPATVTGSIQTSTQLGHLDPAILEAVRHGTPLLAIPQADSLSEGVAKQLAAAGAFAYHGAVGDFRAPWMGNWYFVREHPVFAGLPVNQAMGIHYQAHGRQSNGLLVESLPGGPQVEILVGYSRDHDRNIGAGTFTTRLGKAKVLFHRVPELHPVLQQRFLANAIAWLTS